jgi:hypothetical protein
MTMRLSQNDLVDVAHAPSNVRDVAEGKSFTFITIVIRNGMRTLVRAASALMPTLANTRFSLYSHECEYGTHECVRYTVL